MTTREVDTELIATMELLFHGRDRAEVLNVVLHYLKAQGVDPDLVARALYSQLGYDDMMSVVRAVGPLMQRGAAEKGRANNEYLKGRPIY